MPEIKEIDVLSDWTLSMDHFYSIVKASLGELSNNGKYQIQSAAIPLDIDKGYEWFSRGNVNIAFDVALEPTPISDRLVHGLQVGIKLSGEYKAFISKALSLVETKELDEDTLSKIDKLKVEIENLEDEVSRNTSKLSKKWIDYCESTATDKGNKTVNAHWIQGQPESARIKDAIERMNNKNAILISLRDREYDNPDHQELVEAMKKLVSPAATMRYPRFEDSTYTEERSKFSVTYFASLPPNESNLFNNFYMMTPTVSLDKIIGSQFGRFTSKIQKTSQSNHKVSTDWGHSGSVSLKAFKIKSDVSYKQKIQDDFKSVQEVSVSVESLMAIPYNASTWFLPSVFRNPVILENIDIFERWLGVNGTLHVIPTHLVVCRGFKIVFSNSQNWNYDYKQSFEAGGDGSASIFGIKFGSRDSFSRNVERQRVETRQHDLVFDDGAENIRILGYHTMINKNTL